MRYFLLFYENFWAYLSVYISYHFSVYMNLKEYFSSYECLSLYELMNKSQFIWVCRHISFNIHFWTCIILYRILNIHQFIHFETFYSFYWYLDISLYAGMPHFIELCFTAFCRLCVLFFKLFIFIILEYAFFFRWLFWVISHQVSQSAPFYHQHLHTSCLCERKSHISLIKI